MVGYAAERRDFTWGRLGPRDLDAPLPEPTQAQLRAHYDENRDAFTTPPSKRLTYALLTPEMLIDEIDLPEADLRREYEARAETYIRPERRLVERLSFPDAAAARDARAAIEDGETSFEAIVNARGLELADIDLGDVTRAELGADAAEPVFAAETGDIVGPVKTDLGPALFRVNGVLAAQETSFEEARPELRAALAADRARRMIETRMEEVDDLLAGGATLEELPGETPMQVDEMLWNETVDAGPAAYAAFSEAAAAVTAEDYPEVRMLDDGGIFALRLDAEVPAQVKPFDAVRATVADRWRAERTRDRLAEQARALLPEMESGADGAMPGINLFAETGITRNGFIRDAPRDMVAAVFDMDPGEARVVRGADSVAVVRLDAVRAPDADAPEVAQMRQRLAQQAGDALAQDFYGAFADAVRARAGVSLNQQAINAVHSNFQ